MKSKSARSVAILGISSSLLLVATLLPAANALELSVTSSVEVDLQKSAAIVEPGTTEFLFLEDDLTATASGAIFSTQLALVSAVSRQVELARTAIGAKKVARSILMDEYGFEEKEYKCLNRLWTKESNWNYKSRNKKSGAHGIPQALPASKMNVVSTDWRTNPVTQIRWGLRYISIRYETHVRRWPSTSAATGTKGASSKFFRSGFKPLNVFRLSSASKSPRKSHCPCHRQQ